MLPAGSNGEIQVKAAGYQNMTITASFTAPIPQFLVSTVPGQGDTNRAPVVTMKADSYEKTQSGRNRVVTVSIVDPDNETFTYAWQTTMGSLATSAGNLTAQWSAPAGSGIATVSVIASDSKGAIGQAFLGLEFGTGGSTASGAANFPPIVNIVATGANFSIRENPTESNRTDIHVKKNAQLQLIANASDDDGDTLTYLWYSNSGSFSNTSQREATWTAPAISTWTYIGVRVSDGKTAASTTRSIGIEMNLPTARVDKPLDRESLGAGDIIFKGSARDSYANLMSVGGGNTTRWFLNGKQFATDVLDVSYPLGLPATYTVAFQIIDAMGLSSIASVQFRVNATPTVTIASPANNAVFKPNTAITFVATSSDVEDGTLGNAILWKWNGLVIAKGATFATSGLSIPGSYTIFAVASDSFGQFAATTAVTIGISTNSSPLVSITTPTANQLFLQNQTVNFQGTANDPEDGALANANVGWYDGAVTPATFLGSGTTIARTDLTTGAHKIFLTAFDSLGFVSSTTVDIYVNTAPTATITAPLTNKAFGPGELLTFTGQASDTEDGGVISDPQRLGWFRGAWGQNWLASGTMFQNSSLPVGNNLITFGGADVKGTIGTATIYVGIGGRPNLYFSPASDTVFAENSTVTFVGSGTDVDTGLPLAATSFKWYINGAHDPKYNGSSTWSVSTGFIKDQNTVMFEAQSVAGIVASLTKRLIWNATPTVSISPTVPTANTRFDTGSSITFNGVAQDPTELGNTITLTWYSYNWTSLATQTFQTVTRPHNSAHTFSFNGLGIGTHTISLCARDSYGFMATDTRVILVNSLPSIPTISIPGAFATAGNTSIVMGAYGALTSITFARTNSVDPDGGTPNYAWAMNGINFSDSPATNYSLNYDLGGLATVTLRISDPYSVVFASLSIKLWQRKDAITSGLTTPTGIAVQNVAGSPKFFITDDTTNLIHRYDTNFILEDSSDDPASTTARLGILGLQDGTLAGISGSAAGDTVYTIQAGAGAKALKGWRANDFNFFCEGGAGVTLNNPLSVLYDQPNSMVFVSNSGANKLSKYQLSGKTPTTEYGSIALTGANTPWGVALGGTNLFLADNPANRLRKYSAGTLNEVVDTNWPITITTPRSVTVIGSHVFTSYGTGNTVRVYDTSGNLATSFNLQANSGQILNWNNGSNQFMLTIEGTKVVLYAFGTSPL
jgi:hypothetical protein